MTVEMDTDTAELLLAEIGTMWARPLSEYEIDEWRRTIRSHMGIGLDPELVATTLNKLRHLPQWQDNRPNLADFVLAYDEIWKAHQPPPPDPAMAPATATTVHSVLDECRQALARASEVRDELDIARSRLLHEMVRADIAQGRLL
jgi:hypothetical protein